MSGVLHSKKKQSQPLQNVKVVVRIRPLTKQEDDQNVKNILKCPTHKEVFLRDKKYSFDRVFEPSATQIELYLNVVSPLIEDVVSGYNCTVFAYGQTGTGKTYTMTGEKCNLIGNWNEDQDAGIIPRAAFHIYDMLNNLSNVEMNVKVSYIELYNEEIRDLLSEDESTLQIYTDNKGVASIQGITEISVHNSEGICKLLQRGIVKRQIAPTLMNHQISRSHTVFTITVNTRESTATGDDILKSGKINLVDLAGSENIARSGCKDITATELANINRSLLTLGRVIYALVDKNQKHVPFRDSKLTRILQDSLGGHTKTVVIATVSPANNSQEETICTLEYATRARDIKNTPIINEKLTKHEIMEGLVKEIDRLQKDLDAARSGTGFYVDKENCQRMLDAIMAVTGEQLTPEELTTKKAERINDLKEHMEAKVRQFEETVELCKKHEEELKKVKAAIKEKDETLEQERFLAKWYESHSSEKFVEAQNLLKTTMVLSNEKEVLLSKLEQQFKINVTNKTAMQNAVSKVLHTVNNFGVEESEKMKKSEEDMQQHFKGNLVELKNDLKNYSHTLKNVSGILDMEEVNNFSVKKSIEDHSEEHIEGIRKKTAHLENVFGQYTKQLDIFKTSVPLIAEEYRAKTEEFFQSATQIVKESDESMKNEILEIIRNFCDEIDILKQEIADRNLEDEKNLRELEILVERTKNNIQKNNEMWNRIGNLKGNATLVEKKTEAHILKKFEDCAKLVPEVEEIQSGQVKSLLFSITEFENKLTKTFVDLDKKYKNKSQQIENTIDNEVDGLLARIDAVAGITQRFVNSYQLFSNDMKQILEEQVIRKNVAARHAGDTPIRESMRFPTRIQDHTPRETLLEKFRQAMLPQMEEEWDELQ